MERLKVNIHTDACVGCGACARVCAAHTIGIEQGKAKVVSNDCIFCGQCGAVCPKRAVEIEGYPDDRVEITGEVRLDPQQVLDAIRFRRSIRRFRDESIPRKILEDILEAGRLTHTAKNRQDVSFAVLEREKARMEQMAVRVFRNLKPFADLFDPMARRTEIDEDFFFFRAPTAIVILAKDKTNGILAAQNMEFVAEAHGLGVLYSGFFTMAANLSRKIKKALGKPRGKKIAMTLVLGYPDVKFRRSTQHKPLDVRWL